MPYTLASMWSLGDLLFGRAFEGQRDAVHTVAMTATGLALLSAMLGIAGGRPPCRISYFVLLSWNIGGRADGAPLFRA